MDMFNGGHPAQIPLDSTRFMYEYSFPPLFLSFNSPLSLGSFFVPVPFAGNLPNQPHANVTSR